MIDANVFYNIYDVKRILHEEKSIMIGSEKLYVGAAGVAALAHARKVVISVASLGKEPEALMKKYSGEKDYLSEYYMDVLCVKALASLCAAFDEHMQKTARSFGLLMSSSLQPGNDEWDMSAQGELLRLSGGAEAGIKINSAHVLIPFMSVSSLAGMGEEYLLKEKSDTQHENCENCNKYDSCSWRRENS